MIVTRATPTFLVVLVWVVGLYQGSSQDYQYSVGEESVEIIKYMGQSENVIIPSAIEGKPVTKIGDWSFFQSDTITQVVIPEGVLRIGVGAFAECTHLRKVIIPSTTTAVGAHAFTDCPSLEAACFAGDAPFIYSNSITLPVLYVFVGSESVHVLYLPNSTGWKDSFSSRPTAIWQPRLSAFPLNKLQVRFNIDWAKDYTVEVEAADNLSVPVWTKVATVGLNSGVGQFALPVDRARRYFRLKWE